MAFGLPLPVDQLTNYGSSITIEETSGAGPGWEPRKVVLLGNGLPHVGATWGRESNIKTRWYPGNPIEATQQVLGTMEVPSAWEGEWKRTMMGRLPCVYIDEAGLSNQIVEPHVLLDVIEQLQLAGMRLRVTWAVRGHSVTGSVLGVGSVTEDDVKFVREGRISKFVTPVNKHTDIKWNLEFVWLGRGGSTQRVVSTRDDVDLADVANSLIASTAATELAVDRKIKSVKESVRKSANLFTLGQLETLAAAPREAVDKLVATTQQQVDQFKSIGELARKSTDILVKTASPETLINASVHLARGLEKAGNDFIDEVGRGPIELYALKQTVTAQLRSARYFYNIAQTVILNNRRAYELDVKARKTLAQASLQGTLSVRASLTTRPGLLIAVHISKEGDTPQKVSQLYYKTADHGVDILKANRLPWYTPKFYRGQILIIPVLTNRIGA